MLTDDRIKLREAEEREEFSAMVDGWMGGVVDAASFTKAMDNAYRLGRNHEKFSRSALSESELETAKQGEEEIKGERTFLQREAIVTAALRVRAFVKTHDYPAEFSEDWQELTRLLDALDTALRLSGMDFRNEIRSLSKKG